MEIKRSEKFLYFQNKAIHYSNIKNAKSILNKEKTKPNYIVINPHKTCDYQVTQNSQSKDNHAFVRDKDSSRLLENEEMFLRLMKISKSKRTELEVQGGYSRYNSDERKFRSKNPKNEEAKKKIKVENEMFGEKLCKAKPLVGSNTQWYTEYQRQLSHRKNISRYSNGEKSKDSLHLETSRFIPKHYKKYLEDVENEEKEANTSKEKERISETMKVISDKKLTALPKILNNGRSVSVLEKEEDKREEHYL